ncbi:unnamed protein product, partial [Nesidiocoris tenuis]
MGVNIAHLKNKDSVLKNVYTMVFQIARAARGVQGGAESSTFLESWKKTAGKRIAYAKVTSFEDYLDT